jgi:hypothetical protein
MNLIEKKELTQEERTRAEEFIIELDFRKTKRKGDAAWREIDQITGLGDYIPGQDDGEPPADYSRLEN